MLETDIQPNIRKEYLESDDFKEDLILQNIRRGKLLAIIVISIEMVLLSIDIASSLLHVSNTFSFNTYMVMYFIMIILNFFYLFSICRFSKKHMHKRTMSAIVVLYVILIMVWGSVISLMDQRLYGHLMSFMVNMMVCSIIYLMDAKTMLIPYLCSYLVLIAGLPFFQKSGNVLIGHYVNSTVFAVIAWTASRISYRNYCDNYVIKALMDQANSLLEKETEENRIINKKLAAANEQLKKLALVDDLTGLPNRRSFREFIDKMVQNNPGSTVSVIMIDVDYFKQYNDFYGHEKGDLALIAVANQINIMLEDTNQIATRWGGEEFIFAAFNTSQEGIVRIAHEIKMKVLDIKIPAQSSSINPYLTVSLGTCTGTISSAKQISKIIDMADQALYLAKDSGRNYVATMPCNDTDED